MGIRCVDHVTPLYPQKLALTSPTGGGRSVDIVRSRTKATDFFFFCLSVENFTNDPSGPCNFEVAPTFLIKFVGHCCQLLAKVQVRPLHLSLPTDVSHYIMIIKLQMVTQTVQSCTDPQNNPHNSITNVRVFQFPVTKHQQQFNSHL